MTENFVTAHSRSWVPYVIIGAPYAWYLYCLMTNPANPIVPDSFRYLWPSDISAEFFIGGSLSFRSLAYLLGNHPLAITSTVLMCFLAAETSLFNTFKGTRYLTNCLFALGIAVLFDSSFILGIHQKVSPKGFFVAMHLLFITSLFRANGGFSSILAFIIGLIFVLSRNVAPYIVIASVVAYTPFIWSRKHQPKIFSLLLPLIIVSIIAANFTREQDSSVQMNAANNMLARVIDHPDLLKKFVSSYGMPPGPYIEACQNYVTPSTVVACFEHTALATSDMSTFSYTLLDDPWGFSEWVKKHGAESWQDHLLLEQPIGTFTEFASAFRREFETPFGGSGSNLLPFDAHSGIRALSSATRVTTLWGICILFIASGLAYLMFSTPSIVAGASILAGGSVANIFVSYYGDAMEIGRHTYPGYATLSIALGMLFIGVGFAIITNFRNNLDR